MIQASEEYKNLVKSNIRPKCEPIIRVFGKDANGEKVEVIWKAENLKSLTFKRGIDPVGKQLPFLQLDWAETYLGKMNAENFPEKYNNIVRFMAVELTFCQTLKNNTTENFKMPLMFLESRPKIEGQNIKWTAKDILSFLNTRQVYKGESDNLKTNLRYFVLNERINFIKNLEMFWALQDINDYLKSDEVNLITGKNYDVIFDDTTKNLLINAASVFNYYFDFNNHIMKIYNLENLEEKEKIPVDMFVMYKNPVITSMSNISSYFFNNYLPVELPDKTYSLKPTATIPIGNLTAYKYDFEKYGQPADRHFSLNNLFVPKNESEYKKNGLTLKNNKNGEFVLYGKSENESNTEFVVSKMTLLGGKQYTFSLQGNNSKYNTEDADGDGFIDEDDADFEKRILKGISVVIKRASTEGALVTFDAETNPSFYVGSDLEITATLVVASEIEDTETGEIIPKEIPETGLNIQIMINEGNNADEFDFDNNSLYVSASEVSYTLSEYPVLLTVIPIDLQKRENFIVTNSLGEPFNENNKLNPYSSLDVESQNRLTFLNKYFNQNNKTVEIECLPNLMIETGDVIDAETNLYDGDEKIRKNCLVVQEEFNYTGALKQKIYAHEVSWL